MSKKLLKISQPIYFIGLKGVGMTMLAQFLKAKGHRVSGSDIQDVFLTDQVLRAAKISVLSPFDPKNIPTSARTIIYSSAYNPATNSELAYLKNNPARLRNVQLLSYAEALGQVFNRHDGIAVCGSHGKTTTAAWLGYVLWQAGQQPNVLVGSRVPQFKGSSLAGRSRTLVAEVDEYQNKLKYFWPRGVVLNNIDYDHPDFFKTPASYTKVFADLVKKIPARGFLVMNNRDLASRTIKKSCRGRVISYDLVTGDYGSGADYLAYDLRANKGYQYFRVSYQNQDLGEFKIQLGGEHNVLNALAVIAASRAGRVALEKIRKHLGDFSGTERRAQILGRYRGALIIDDYGHHPTEIKTTLAGLRSRYPKKKIITVFHPHTFTRTKAFFKDFTASFSETDELIILDIYGSAREKIGGVSSRQLAGAIKKFNQRQGIRQTVQAIPQMPAVAHYLRRHLKFGDILLLLGAGDVFRVADFLLKKS